MANIYFDIDNTLFPSSEFSVLARRNAIKAMIREGLNYKEEYLLKVLNKIIEEKGSNYSRHFDVLCKRLRIKNKDRFVAAAIASYHDTKAAILPYPEVPYVLMKLKEREHSLFVVSEGIKKKQWDKLIRLNLQWFFDDVFITKQKTIRFYKKLKKGYVVGDHPKKDIEFSKKSGHTTIRILRGRFKNIKSNADYEIKDMREILKIIKY